MSDLKEFLRAYFMYFEVFFKATVLDKLYICMAESNIYFYTHTPFPPPKTCFNFEYTNFVSKYVQLAFAGYHIQNIDQ